MRWEYEVDESKLRELIQKYPRALMATMRPALKKAIYRFQRVFQQARLRGRPGLYRRTGDLIKSFGAGISEAGGSLDAMEAWLASRSPYAAIQETGGVLRPTRRKYLAVPLPAALTKAGVLRGPLVGGPLKGESAPSLYNVPGLFLIKSKAGNLLLAMKQGGNKKTGGILPLFVLKKSVNIPARMGFYSSFKSWIGKPRFLRYFRDAVLTAWERTRGKK